MLGQDQFISGNNDLASPGIVVTVGDVRCENTFVDMQLTTADQLHNIVYRKMKQ